MKIEATLYCIKLIYKDGTRGWLIDRPTGIEICVGGVMSDITLFETEQDANKFIRERKLERSGVKAYVRTNQELLDEVSKDGSAGMSSVPLDKPIYHLENQKGEKCFYDSTKEVYFFKTMGEFGFPVWYDEESIRRFAKDMKFQQGAIFMVKHLGKDKEEKTLIQVYGSKKNPDGTMGEPEQIDIEGENKEVKNKDIN